MTAQQLITLIHQAEGIISIALQTWGQIRNAPAGTPEEVKQELDDRYHDYVERIDRAKARSGVAPAGDVSGEPEIIG